MFAIIYVADKTCWFCTSQEKRGASRSVVEWSAIQIQISIGRNFGGTIDSYSIRSRQASGRHGAKSKEDCYSYDKQSKAQVYKFLEKRDFCKNSVVEINISRI